MTRQALCEKESEHVKRLELHVARLERELQEAKELGENVTQTLKVVAQELIYLRAKQFGAKTEKLSSGQISIFEEAHPVDEPEKPGANSAPLPKKSLFRNRRSEGGRKPQGSRKDAFENLPRRPNPVEIPEGEWTCECCSGRKTVIGSEISEQIDFVPASLYVMEHIRPKIACPKCEEGVTIAPTPAKLVKKGLAGFGLVTHIAMSKYGDHLPLKRQESIFERMGLPIARSTMCDSLRAGALLLKPVVDRIRELVVESEVIWTDDTAVKLRIAVEAAALNRRLPESRVWAYRGDSRHPFIFYDFTRSRKRDGPKHVLEGFNGILQADAYAGYDCIYTDGDVFEAACYAHVRRKFFESILSAGETAITAVRMIDALYGVEHEAERIAAKNAYLPQDFFRLRLEMRNLKSRSLVARFKAWLDEQSVLQLPQSRIGKAIKYALNNWAALNTFFLHGETTLDNNLAEGALRRIALGRKNYLFFGSLAGGETAAIYYTLIASAIRNGVEPFKYMRDLLTRLTQEPGIDIDELLPDRWQDKTTEKCERMTLQDSKAPGLLAV